MPKGEIKREPLRLTLNNEEYVAFDEDHTFNDFLRYLQSEGMELTECIVFFDDGENE